VVLVAVQSVSSIRTLKMVRDTLEREEGIRPQRLVINRYEPALPGFTADQLAKLLQVPQVQTVANDYPAVMAALNLGKPLALSAPESGVRADIRGLALTIEDRGSRIEDRGSREANSSAPEEPDEVKAIRSSILEPRASSKEVLHIEDDPVQQHLVAAHLARIKDLACRITTAQSESEAVELFRKQPFDIVLLDYHLAQGNGLGCLRQLRALDPIVPVVVVSSLSQPQVAAELLDAGADDFLSKENLSGERLARSLSAAAARADACKQRLASDNPTETARVDAFFECVRKTIGVRDEGELLHNLHELQKTSWPSRFSAGQIQRLVDLVCSELDRAPPSVGGELPRRALLALFLRLFGGDSREIER
jgi:CheY-like chemotaxis protein